MKKCLLVLFFSIFTAFFLLAFSSSRALAIGDPSPCAGTPVDLGIEKKLLTIGPYPSSGRQGDCGTPKYIIIHTTQDSSTTAEQIYQYFETGGAGTGSQFVVGHAGDAIQMGETGTAQVDVLNHAWGNNSNAIGIEITRSGNFASKADVPPPQYQKVLELVRKLMGQYNIPINAVGYGFEWKAPSDNFVEKPGGIYGHYQVNPQNKNDPGAGFLKDLMEEAAALGPIAGGGGGSGGSPQSAKSNCVVTKIGNPPAPPVLPPNCPVGSGGLGPIPEGIQMPPNMGPENTEHPGYFELPPSLDGSYQINSSCPLRHWGSPLLIGVIYTAAKNWKAKYPQGYLIPDDLNGGDPHVSHNVGRAVDIVGTTDGNDQVGDMTRGNYNQAATTEFGKILANTNQVLSIWYNDQPVSNAVLAYSDEPPGHSQGMVMAYEDGHYNHFHLNVKLDPLLSEWTPPCG